MKKSKIIFWSAINSLGTVIYILLIALFITSAQSLFGKINSFWGPLAMLLLFVVSATITGLLVLGRPIWLYLNNGKIEAVKLLFYTVGWLVSITLIIFILLFLIK
jgi:hypothetical protein